MLRLKQFIVKLIEVSIEEETAVNWEHYCNNDAYTGHPEIKVVTWCLKFRLLESYWRADCPIEVGLHQEEIKNFIGDTRS